MAAPQAISGNLGRVYVGGSQVAEIKSWKLTINRNAITYAAQSGVVNNINWKKTVSGTHDWSGSFEGVFDPNYAIGAQADTDALFTIILYRSYLVSWYSGQCRINTEDHSCDIESGDPQPFTYNFQGHGAITEINV